MTTPRKPRPPKPKPVWQKKLCSVYEIAQLMGVSKGRVSQYADAAWFPKPVDNIQSGRIWSYPEVVKAWTAHRSELERHRPPTGYAEDQS